MRKPLTNPSISLRIPGKVNPGAPCVHGDWAAGRPLRVEMRIWSIAFTHYESDPRVRRETESLVQSGSRVTVVCLRRPGQAPEEQRGAVRLIRLPITRRRGRARTSYLALYLRFMLAAFARTTRAALAGQIDAVHIHTMPDSLVFAALAPRFLGKKIVLDVHDTMPELYSAKFGTGGNGLAVQMLRLQERLATAFASQVIAVHDLHRERLIANGTKPSKITVLMNLPDERLFSTNGTRPGRFRLVYHGTLAPRHCLETPIRACALLRNDLPDLQFQIVGDGESRQSLVNLVSDLGLEGVVSFSPGPVPVDWLPRILAEADLGIVSPRLDPSTHLMLPTKLLEYLHMDIPVICSPLRTVIHYFGEDGLTYADPSDPGQWAEAIRRHLTDPDLGRRQIERAKRFFERHSWSREKEKLLRIYGLEQ